MNQRNVKMIRRQLKKFRAGEVRAAFDALQEIASLPLRQRLWFAWRIIVVRKFN